MVRTTMVEVRVLGPVALSAADIAELGVHRSVECTLLEATVRDQAALYGLLQRLGALGLELLELRTASPGRRADVEVVVRGPIGTLMQEMLHDVDRAVPTALTSYQVRDTDLVGLLTVVSGLPSRARAGEGSSGEVRREAGDAHLGVARAPARTEESRMDRDIDELGPVDFVVVEFPGKRLDDEALQLLLDLVERGIIRVLDLAFLQKSPRGEVSGVELQDLEVANDFDVTVFEGASSGILDGDDLQEAGASLRPGSCGGVLVYENAWAGPFAAALRRGGASLVAGGRIPLQSIAAALDADEAG